MEDPMKPIDSDKDTEIELFEWFYSHNLMSSKLPIHFKCGEFMVKVWLQRGLNALNRRFKCSVFNSSVTKY